MFVERTNKRVTYKIRYSFGGNAQQSREGSVTTTLTDAQHWEMDQVLRAYWCAPIQTRATGFSQKGIGQRSISRLALNHRGDRLESRRAVGVCRKGCEALELEIGHWLLCAPSS